MNLFRCGQKERKKRKKEKERNESKQEKVKKKKKKEIKQARKQASMPVCMQTSKVVSEQSCKQAKGQRNSVTVTLLSLLLAYITDVIE